MKIRFFSICRMKTKETQNHFLLLLFFSGLLVGCQSGQLKDSNIGHIDHIEELKKIRKYTIKFAANSVPVVIKQASLGVSPPTIYLSPDMEKVYTNAFVKLLGSAGNHHAKFIKYSDLALIDPASGTSELENQKWLKTLGIDTVITVTPGAFHFDYSTRLPDLKFGNILYTFFLLDIWWIDMIGKWHADHDFGIAIGNFQNGDIISRIHRKIRIHTGAFRLNGIDSYSFTQDLQEKVEESLTFRH